MIVTFLSDWTRSARRARGVRLATLALLTAVGACNSASSTVEPVDAGAALPDFNLVSPDRYIPPNDPFPDVLLGDANVDNGPQDALPDLSPDVSTPDARARIDGGADAAPLTGCGVAVAGNPTEPARDQLVVIPQLNKTWVAFVSHGWLYRRCFVTNGAANDCDTVDAVARVGEPEFPLQGIATPNGLPWVVTSDPQTHEAVAYDVSALTDGCAPPFRLGIYGPIKTGMTGTRSPNSLIVGHLAAGGSQLGILRLPNEHFATLPYITSELDGLPLPDSIVPQTDGAVFGLSTGECAVFKNRTVPDRVEFQGSWRCGDRPGAILGGRVNSLFLVDRNASTFEVSLRLVAPGHVATLETPPGPSTRVVLGSQAITWDTTLPRIDGGGMFFTDGGGATKLWLVRSGDVRSFDVPDPTHVFGVAPVGNNEWRQIAWNAATGAFDFLNAEPAEHDVPPTFEPGGACGATFGPEVCDGLDNDCNGTADDGLCCAPVDRPATSDAVSAVHPLGALQPVGISDDGFVYISLNQDRVEVQRSLAGDTSHQQTTPPVTWSGYQRIAATATKLSNVLIVAETTAVVPPDAGPPPMDAAPPAVDAAVAPAADAAPPPVDAAPLPVDAAAPAVQGVLQVMWLSSGVRHDPMAAPCDTVLDARMLADNTAARIYCADRAVDVLVGDGMGIPQLYPAGDPVQWISRGIYGDTSLTLVARGADHHLEMWRDDDAGGFVVVDNALPVLLNQLTPAERTTAIHIPGAADAVPVRVTEGGRLEALLADGPVGWTDISGNWNPRYVAISSTEPLAYNFGDLTGPEIDDAHSAVYVHDLRAGHQPWGARLHTSDAATGRRANDFKSLAPALYAPVPADPRLPRVFRVVGSTYTIEGYPVTCSVP